MTLCALLMGKKKKREEEAKNMTAFISPSNPNAPYATACGTPGPDLGMLDLQAQQPCMHQALQHVVRLDNQAMVAHNRTALKVHTSRCSTPWRLHNSRMPTKITLLCHRHHTAEEELGGCAEGDVEDLGRRLVRQTKLLLSPPV